MAKKIWIPEAARKKEVLLAKQIYIIIFLIFCLPVSAQLRIGSVSSEINFREGPGLNYKVIQKIDNSNLIVVLPREAHNGFLEVFDVETSSRGYIAESLIKITDTLYFGKQNFFEKSGSNETGDVEIVLINRTNKTIYVWINKAAYDIAPREKKALLMEEAEIIYFASGSGMFPVFGREMLKKGETYNWNFSM